MLNSVYYSLLLSQILGSFMFITAIIMMSRVYFYRRLILKLQPEDPALMISALFCLFLGLVLVVTHNVWAWKSVSFLTALCWLILLKGVFWFALPEKMVALTKKICAGNGYYWVIVFLLVWGILFLTKGVEVAIMQQSLSGTNG